ncbi:hypothetical protein MRB53_018668 [Persea americana]|uniref:Uncharacterized protein n=1 Tax=Persea americana TaxID=3435 RepID=A0ACC2M8M8_PERAE|nr:hypothetical protein MRB53_018668 [Persea americana]
MTSSGEYSTNQKPYLSSKSRIFTSNPNLLHAETWLDLRLSGWSGPALGLEWSHQIVWEGRGKASAGSDTCDGGNLKELLDSWDPRFL